MYIREGMVTPYYGLIISYIGQKNKGFFEKFEIHPQFVAFFVAISMIVGFFTITKNTKCGFKIAETRGVKSIYSKRLPLFR